MFLFSITSVTAQEISLFDQSLEIEIFDQQTLIDLQVSAAISSTEDSLELKAEGEITIPLKLAARKLVEQVTAKNGDCEERWSAWDSSVFIAGDTLRASITVKVEKWLCKHVLGKELKTWLAQETATFHASIKPRVLNQQLKLEITDFQIDDLGSILRALNVEQHIARELEKIISEVNQNDSFRQLPSELSELGFGYNDIQLANNAGRNYLRVSISGPNNVSSVLKLVAELVKRGS